MGKTELIFQYVLKIMAGVPHGNHFHDHLITAYTHQLCAHFLRSLQYKNTSGVNSTLISWPWL
jgi:hypothetical protein